MLCKKKLKLGQREPPRIPASARLLGILSCDGENQIAWAQWLPGWFEERKVDHKALNRPALSELLSLLPKLAPNHPGLMGLKRTSRSGMVMLDCCRYGPCCDAGNDSAGVSHHRQMGSRPEQMPASGYAHNLGTLALGRSKGMGIWRWHHKYCPPSRIWGHRD